MYSAVLNAYNAEAELIYNLNVGFQFPLKITISL